MIAELSLGGVLVPIAAATAVAAFALLVALSALGRRAGLYRLIWHPGLFDLALFFILWGALSALAPRLPADWLVGS
jgi:protein AaeX